MNTVLYILRFPILVFVLNVILDARGLYYALPWIDMPMHFLGGASIGLAGVGFLALLQKQGLINTLPFLLYAFFIMSFVGLAALIWELWEFALNIQVDLPDTMADMFFGLLGGFTALIVCIVLRGKTRY